MKLLEIVLSNQSFHDSEVKKIFRMFQSTFCKVRVSIVVSSLVVLFFHVFVEMVDISPAENSYFCFKLR